METWMLAAAAFVVTSILVLWRPGGMHETVPALIGASVVFLSGLLTWEDIGRVAYIVTNAGLVIISTAVMASILDGAGFFNWVAWRLADRAGGSGHLLFALVMAFSICLTWFLNNDGSILIGTPIIATLVQRMRLSQTARFAFLISACLLASAASSPVAVSNMANLEAMAIAGVSLSEHFRYLFIPASLGMLAAWGLLHAVFRAVIPARVAVANPDPSRIADEPVAVDRHRGEQRRRHLMWIAVTVVVIVRAGIFTAPYAGVPLTIVPVTGAVLLLALNLRHRVISFSGALRQAPWLLIVFAFGMDLVVFGLRNAGVTGWAAEGLGNLLGGRPLAIGAMSLLMTTIISAVLNNHPGMIVGSITITQLTDVPAVAHYAGYSGVILGADLGALVTPVGTLASLLWFHVLGQRGYDYRWAQYVRVTLVVIPISMLAALIGLALVLAVTSA